MPINHDAAVSLAKRSRGTPRIANRLFKRVRDFATMSENSDFAYKELDEVLSYYELSLF